MANYFRTLNDQGQNVRTDRNDGETVPDHLVRHVNDVLAAMPGWIVGLELCTRWETSATAYFDSCTSRNPGETDAEYLDRHFAQVADNVGKHPPS